MEDIKTIPIEKLLDVFTAAHRDAVISDKWIIVEKIRSEIIRRCEEK